MEVGWEDNPWFPEVLEKERQAFLRQVKSGARRQEEYDNIWGGKCKPAVEGAIYADEVAKVLKDGRLCEVPYQSTFPVYTIWDLGWADSMAIVFVQCIAGGIRFIDYIEDSHRTYESYVKQIKEKDYQLGKAWLPHDGKACNPQTGRSPITTLQNLKLDTSDETIPDPGKEEGIRLTRMAFPRFYFDKKKCGPLFNCLRRYARIVSKDTEEPMGTKKDANAHGADAVRYTAVIEPELYERSIITKDPYAGFGAWVG
ncbi:MAG: hypothetical protein IIB77_03265 [Proteobacteria bacterium]|nr:hypothetical protein [Pseudomonadota bacterium]